MHTHTCMHARMQMPTSWRSIMEDSSTLTLFLQLYSTSSPPRSAQGLECLVQIASVRRSIFSNEARHARAHTVHARMDMCTGEDDARTHAHTHTDTHSQHRCMDAL